MDIASASFGETTSAEEQNARSSSSVCDATTTQRRSASASRPRCLRSHQASASGGEGLDREHCAARQRSSGRRCCSSSAQLRQMRQVHEKRVDAQVMRRRGAKGGRQGRQRRAQRAWLVRRAPDLRAAPVALQDLPRARCGRARQREQARGVYADRGQPGGAGWRQVRADARSQPLRRSRLRHAPARHWPGAVSALGRRIPANATCAARTTWGELGCSRSPKHVCGPPPPRRSIALLPSGLTMSSTMSVKAATSSGAEAAAVRAAGRCAARVPRTRRAAGRDRGGPGHFAARASIAARGPRTQRARVPDLDSFFIVVARVVAWFVYGRNHASSRKNWGVRAAHETSCPPTPRNANLVV